MHDFYPTLLSPLAVGGRVLKNRMICPPSAPGTIQGPQNYPSETLIQYYADRARNGAAIVTCSGGYLHQPDAQGHMWGYNVTQGLTQNMMSQMAEAIHLYGSLAHGFLIGFPQSGYDVSNFDPEKNSEIRFMLSEPFVEMPNEMVYETIDTYIKQVKAFRECGFDGVNIHMCYRFSLTARFLSPMTNLRTDEFGDSLQNRMRFAKLLCGGIKKACGRDFLIEVTISGHDPVAEGWTIQDSITFSKEMKGLVDIMTVRSSTLDPQHPTGYEENPRPWAHMAEEIKKGSPEIAVAASSGLFDPDANEEILASGKADLVSMARAFISNPRYGECVQKHKPQDLIPCIRCNKCINRGPSESWLTVCTVNPRRGMEPFMDRLKPSGKQKKVAVIGGGPAGMVAALTAAEQGHTVHLYEKTDRLGGLLKHTDHVSFKWPLRDYKDYLIRKVRENEKITLHLSANVTPEELDAQGFDTVLAATGSLPAKPPIPGIESGNVRFAVDIFGHEEDLGRNVVVIGGGEVGVETGIYLARAGHSVTVLEMTDMLARESNRGHYYSMVQAAWEKEENFRYILNATCTGISETVVQYRDAEGQEHLLPADSVVISAGMRAQT
ncbi:MAG: FAD-dependent oxidoreductase, partial [Oscillospiraceae bacterium]|nr:FAD-dependent oxidoreductase [Oscillospiraceae bacterium]